MVLGFDFETSLAFSQGYDERAYPVCLCVLSDTGIKQEWVFNHDELSGNACQQDMIKEIQEIISSADILVAHNLKFDAHWLRRLGIDFSHCKLHCTQVAEYLIHGQNNRVRYALDETSLRYEIPPKIDRVKLWWDSGYETCEIPLNILIPYCYQDVANTLAIYQKQLPIIKEQGLEKLVLLGCELSRVLEDIEWNGMMIDVQKCKEQSEIYAKRIAILNDCLIKLVRFEIPEFKDLPETDTKGKQLPNFGSSEQLSTILFGGDFKYDGRVQGKKEGTTKNGKVILRIAGLGFVPRDGTETKSDGIFSTDKAQFDGLKPKTKSQRAFLDAVSELSVAEKMKGTYYDGMLKHEIKGYVHCNIKQTRTVTGRFSATDPPVQTIPRGSTSDIKEVFISRYKE